ncbi:FAD-binding oxidoreductase [Streptomyces sp. NPDC002896]|uniref:NAD(P)/FAD-dependent oxidoreductase n=1 Tax=Streptomyces sp. NPDC002896 TaxID=3154438 RepID=UPI00331D272E
MTGSTARRNGEVSHWYAASGIPSRRPPLPGHRTVDVCITGGGLTGLWTAYYLKRAKPELDIVVVEREFAGFGASGRNGGWLTSGFAAPRRRLAATHGRDAVVALQRAMQKTVDEVIAVCDAESIDAKALRCGILHVARSEAQLARMHTQIADDRRWGLTEDDIRELTGKEVAARLQVEGALGATFNPHGARVQPADLVRGLADCVERAGVTIYEQTEVTEVVPGRAITRRGIVSAPIQLTCLEGFTASLRGHRRDWLPLNSAMVVTEPLPDTIWDQIGWEGCELLGDRAHAYIYAQRTSDGRVALGGRGVPYRYGSRTDSEGRTQRRTVRQLTSVLHEMFPVLKNVPIDHAWCGVLGVPRNWTPTVHFESATGLGIAGGYVGNGVATANLAGRTLRDLVLGETTDLTALPWINQHARAWEPEPLRYLGAGLVYALYREADRRESRGLRRTSALAKAATWVSGR